jgi:4-hydroxy-3-polyprenylbenzoate decarboxylase
MCHGTSSYRLFSAFFAFRTGGFAVPRRTPDQPAAVRDKPEWKRYNRPMNRRIIVAITGASGSVYGIRTLEILRTLSVETDLIVSEPARRVMERESVLSADEVNSLASRVHRPDEIHAPIASGSCPVDGMVIAPCSIKTLSAVAHSYTADLISRAADVCLKEGRPLVLMIRESPLHLGHLRLMARAAESGAVICPPIPVFYGRPQTVEDMVDASVGRALARVGIDNTYFPRWTGVGPSGDADRPEH